MEWAALVLVLATPLTTASTLDLNEAIRQAAHNQPLLQSYRQKTVGARARLTQAQAILYPQAAFAVQALESTANSSPITYLSMPDFVSVGTRPTGSDGARNPSTPEISTLMGFGVHYQLLDFGASRGAIDAAQGSADAADDMAQQALQDAILRVSQAYAQAVAAEEERTVALDILQRAQTHHALAAAGVDSGLKPRIDLARADAELAAANLTVIRAQNNVLVSRSALDTAIGWAPMQTYTLAPLPDASGPTLTQEQALDTAMQARPDLMAIAAEQRAANGRVVAARSGHFPVILATGNVSLRGLQSWPDTFNWNAGLVLTLPMFSGFAVQGQQDEATARLAELHARARATHDAIVYQVRQAHSTLLAARDAVLATRTQVTGALANLTQAEARYKEGLGNIVELTDAQSQYVSAQLGLVQSRLSAALSAVQLTYAYAGLRVPEN